MAKGYIVCIKKYTYLTRDNYKSFQHLLHRWSSLWSTDKHTCPKKWPLGERPALRHCIKKRISSSRQRTEKRDQRPDRPGACRKQHNLVRPLFLWGPGFEPWLVVSTGCPTTTLLVHVHLTCSFYRMLLHLVISKVQVQKPLICRIKC
jgi:hypothetical protein